MIIQIMLQMQCSIDIYIWILLDAGDNFYLVVSSIFVKITSGFWRENNQNKYKFTNYDCKTVKFKIHKQWAKPSCQTGKKSKKTKNYLLDSFPKEIKGCPSMKPFVISICRLFTPCDPNYLKNKSATVHMILVVIIKKDKMTCDEISITQ